MGVNQQTFKLQHQLKMQSVTKMLIFCLAVWGAVFGEAAPGTDVAEKEVDMFRNKVLDRPFLGGWVWGQFPYPWALTNPSVPIAEPGGNKPLGKMLGWL